MSNFGGGTFSVTEVMVVQIGKAGDILKHLLKLLAVLSVAIFTVVTATH